MSHLQARCVPMITGRCVLLDPYSNRYPFEIYFSDCSGLGDVRIERLTTLPYNLAIVAQR